MCRYLPGIRFPKADQADVSAANGERDTVHAPIDRAEAAKTPFAIVLARIFKNAGFFP